MSTQIFPSGRPVIFPSLSFGKHFLHGRPRYLFVPLHFGHIISGIRLLYSPGESNPALFD